MYILYDAEGYLTSADPFITDPPEGAVKVEIPEGFDIYILRAYKHERGKIVLDDEKAARLRADIEAAAAREAAERQRREDAIDVAGLVFVTLAQSGIIDDVTLLEYPSQFIEWDVNWRGAAGSIVRDDGGLYRSLHDTNDAGQNRKPSETPSMWMRIGNPGEEWPEWSQPLGAHDAYRLGAKVTYSGKRWISDVDNNTWVPGVYGWREHS